MRKVLVKIGIISLLVGVACVFVVYGNKKDSIPKADTRVIEYEDNVNVETETISDFTLPKSGWVSVIYSS